MPHSPSATLKGSQIVIRCLERHGVDTVFAYPGGQAIELHQALSKSSIRVILPRHEQGGAFAAGGYARATGKVGVCMATSGPGATNLVSGIADAYILLYDYAIGACRAHTESDKLAIYVLACKITRLIDEISLLIGIEVIRIQIRALVDVAIICQQILCFDLRGLAV